MTQITNESENQAATPQTIYLKDYQPSEFLIPEVHLDFQLFDDHALVKNRMRIVRNSNSKLQTHLLKLDGESAEDALELISISVDGKKLSSGEYQIADTTLTLTLDLSSDTATEAWIEVHTKLQPKKNLAYSGLYQTGKMFCTQCEAEGFRRMTYFLDRPDIMSVYTVRVEADRKKYPVLLSNGNPGRLAVTTQTATESSSTKTDSATAPATTALASGRHEAWWHDPFPKPSYLFALVAGDLAKITDTFKTVSGKDVRLELYCAEGHQDRCEHAMWSLKQAMRWDEEAFGREYDLDIFMIVAADDFNGGAMENKGLNIFNSKYVLAKAETATDREFDGILSVVGHEYFHNWTGNRITCRDWFQLSLKEGLTVFRDQEFSSDMGSREVKRITDVLRLRDSQFLEDSGPLAHPVRPASYIEIDNFYTVTVYEKGAEVIRMLHTLLGPDRFRLGMDHYFATHDGSAVTTEDFVASFEKVAKVDLTQFKRWYDQAGTPTLHVNSTYHEDRKTLSLTVRQELPKLASQAFHMPLVIGLIGKNGEDLKFSLAAEGQSTADDDLNDKTDKNSPKDKTSSQTIDSASDGKFTRVLQIKELQQTFELGDVKEKPVLSLLRGFSAPVHLKFEYSDTDLAFLMAHDRDGVTRWQACQTLMSNEILRLYHAKTAHFSVSPQLVDSFKKVVLDSAIENSFKAKMLNLPILSVMSQGLQDLNVDALYSAWRSVQSALVKPTLADLELLYKNLAKLSGPAGDPKSSAVRELKNTCLRLICSETDNQSARRLALEQIRTANRMSDEIGALGALNNQDSVERTEALQLFYNKWQHESLVINSWFALHAGLPSNTAVDKVKQLTKDPAFDMNNPNKLYYLLGMFGMGNLVGFHRYDGAGYQFMADIILDIDSRNPQVAARLMQAFAQWKNFAQPLASMMQTQLMRIKDHPGVSKNLFEIASKSL